MSWGRGIYIAVCAWLLLLAGPLHAQDNDACVPPTDKKIVKLLEDAAKAREPMERHRSLKATLEVDAECIECHFRLGLSAYRIAKESGSGYKAAIGYLDKVHQTCPSYHSDVPYTLGVMHYAEDRFPEAAKAFEAFRRFPSDDPTRMSKGYDQQYKDVEEIIPELQFYLDFYKNTAPLDPTVLPNVSTPADEYLPMFSPDNELLFFTRKQTVKAKGDIVGREVEELTEARRRSQQEPFTGGRALPDPFNQGDSYGGVTVSVNNKEMFVTVCGPADPRGYRNCDIFRTHYDSKFNLDIGGQEWEWSGLDDLGPSVNGPDSWESQPSLSGDGRTLYYARQAQNTDGMDIFYSTREARGAWSPGRPVPGINTLGDEKAPFMHSDSRTLYFAARPNAEGQGHRSIGGYDIFFTRMGDDGKWSKPQNIGAPINTGEDEHGLVVSADGRTAYFASGRFRGAGGLDIYGFALPKEARPEDVLIVKGEVRDENGQAVKNAQLEIKYMDTRKVDVIEVDGNDGQYAAVLRLDPGRDVIMTVKKEGHVFESRSFSMEDTVRAGVARVDMSVQKIEVGRSYSVSDIRYATSSAEITKSSEYILDELIIFLQENPTVKIRIEGHTDNVGALEKNLALSSDRAFTVMEYLRAKGIPSARLSFQGLGPTKPVASNDTPEGRAQNRRTAFVITSR